jgi:hypothetical protein
MCGPNFISTGLVLAWTISSKFHELDTPKVNFKAAPYVTAVVSSSHTFVLPTAVLRTQCRNTVCGMWLLVPLSQDVSACSGDCKYFMSQNQEIIL